MWYEGLENSISSEWKHETYDSLKILITKRYLSTDYTLRWLDLSLWGTSFMGKEFVRYSIIKIFERVPEELNEITSALTSSFDRISSGVISKVIGRYTFELNSKKWILDVVFPRYSQDICDFNLMGENLVGTTGIRGIWKYDIFEASMSDFVMRIINEIPEDKRSFVLIIRNLMSKMSSVNSDKSLIEGCWGGDYRGGKSPSDWKSTYEIFRMRERTGNPIKYGQCWVYAECFTAMMKFLGIPSRTVFAINSHISLSSTFTVDMVYKQSESKSSSKNGNYFSLIKDIDSFISCDDKGDEDDFDSIFNSRDSMWNIHYWNEVFVPRNNTYSWECIDTCPILESKDEPLSSKKMLGPCLISNIKDGDIKKFDFEYLSSSVNSPIRIWTKSNAIINGELETITYVHSLIYPFYPERSIITKMSYYVLNHKKVKLEILNNETREKEDITRNYIMDFRKLNILMLKNHPGEFKVVDNILYLTFENSTEELYQVQTVFINSKGGQILATKKTIKLYNYIAPEITRDVKYISTVISKNGKHFPQILEI